MPVDHDSPFLQERSGFVVVIQFIDFMLRVL